MMTTMLKTNVRVHQKQYLLLISNYVVLTRCYYI